LKFQISFSMEKHDVACLNVERLITLSGL
jgi:hypothetical protein